MMNPRAIATSVLFEVFEKNRTLTQAFEKYAQHFGKEEGFIKEISFGVCRWFYTLNPIIKSWIKKPIPPSDRIIEILLLVGLYQLRYMRVAEHAAIFETVEAVKQFKKLQYTSFVNALLRKYTRENDEVNALIQSSEVSLYAHPKWFIESVKQAYPEQWQMILEQNNQPGPLCLRVNQNKISIEAYLELLKAQQIEARKTIAPTAIVLDSPTAVEKIPGFLQGNVTVQDTAAQFAAPLLMIDNNMHVLDAAAAPGGKTTHILEIAPHANVVALDQDEKRLVKLRENLERMQQSANIICADAGNLESWWDKKLFDRILLDAPCSGTGVIRRHPDIKILRKPGDIEKLVLEQQRLLSTLWKTLKPGGILLYATCSVLPAENIEIIQQFLSEHPHAEELKIDAPWGLALAHGRQILPGMHEMDGFYFARMIKHL